MEITSIIVAVISGIIGPISLLYLKDKIENRKKKNDVVVDTLILSEKVMDKLEYIKDEFECDRVWVAQFHNGGNFYPTGKSIAKFTINYETVSLNVSSIQSNFQNIPVSLFSKSINQLYENEVIAVSDYFDETIATFGLKYIAEESGCKSGYLFAIKTIDHKFVGILGIDYTKNVRNLDQNTVAHLGYHAASLGGVLVSI